ncbi:MAG: elongation factor G [Alphaproteobacteria bacterium]|jgi:elongation factor G|nr:elongation factor G [Alphaproteobacteria bacterium]
MTETRKSSPDVAAPRCVALVGPQGGGKTSLLESILHITGATSRKGTIKDGTTVGDSTEESKSRLMSTETTPAVASYLGDDWTILDCPGSIELTQETLTALMVVDAAVVVCEPDMQRVVGLAPILRLLDTYGIPHFLFINKIETSQVHMRDLLPTLQASSQRPLVLREVPIRDSDKVTGFIDLVSERAWSYNGTGTPSLVKIPDEVIDREQAARQEMLEALADFDDTLLEQLLEDVQPPTDEIYQQLTKDLREDLIVPVFFGAAESDAGVVRLLKALRHEAPGPQQASARLSAPVEEGAVSATVFKTVHAQHAGKLSYARIWSGTITDGMMLGDQRVSGVYKYTGQTATKVPNAGVGEIVALGRMDAVQTGDTLTKAGPVRTPLWPQPLSTVYAMALGAENRNDEVKLTAAMQKLVEEDPSLVFEQNPEAGGLILRGQGEVHLILAKERLQRRYNVSVTARKPDVPYKETIRKGVHQHARHKKQSGGHGQFGDVHIDIAPLDRGAGFEFHEKVVGGAVPRQFIPSVEAGVRDYLKRGPLGFPVVDVAVTLTDGQYHAVDSSDMAFRTAGRLAMAEGMPKCDPVLLEPIAEVTVYVPSEYTAKAQRILSGRRGQILGFNAREGWESWDEVKAYVPQAEMHDLITELRSLTLGVGSYVSTFSHLQELVGRDADKVIEQRQQQLAAA